MQTDQKRRAPEEVQGSIRRMATAGQTSGVMGNMEESMFQGHNGQRGLDPGRGDWMDGGCDDGER